MTLFLIVQLSHETKASDVGHELTGLREVRAKYGLRGHGQTVAVIDSGIAYNHPALGGGFGPGFRVAGGWDFTEEKDPNPYDDAPNGSHGTHVAGIIGAADGLPDTGVAPAADLIALRVFNDAGVGSFDWIADALQWVHENRNAFRYPITTVNLSFGASWNSDAPPPWATLEDELSRLQEDGIFVAAAAGNEFATYATPGLGYPGASPYVIPVMSLDDAGHLSYFSQRHTRAIAAPGRLISSTVPDFAGDNNGVPDDYSDRSGTNMAAPYVAGASVLIREAMETIGYVDITPATIYNHMIATADTIYDSSTDQYYHRLDLSKAIDSLLPDFNLDGTISAADYTIWRDTLGSSVDLRADANNNGRVDVADYYPWLTAFGSVLPNGILGDFNGDGIVSAADYTVWRDSLGSTSNLRADANDNGIVDEEDYGIWKGNFVGIRGTNVSNSVVPEPVSCTLFLVVFVPMLMMRHRDF